MPLPKQEEKYYSCVVPVSKKTIHFKPFTVRDQKHFLMESENRKEDMFKYNIIYNIVKNCCKEEIDDLYIVDFDYLYFQIRKYSVGESLDLKFKYKYKNENEEELEDTIEYTVNIERDIKCPDTNDEIMKDTFNTGKYIVNIEQPKVKNIIESMNYSDDIKGYLIASMLRSVEESGELHNDFIIEDAKTFIENLTPKEYNKIKDLLNKNPSLYFDKIIKLPKADKEINLGDSPYTDFFLFSW